MANVFVKVCAALIVLRAFTNFAKLLQGDDAVLVMLGRILHGREVMVPAVVVGAFMLATGVMLWRGGRAALPLIATYAAYVAANLLLWVVVHPDELEGVGRRLSSATDPATLRTIGGWAYAAYCVVALGTTAGPAWIVWRR
jgi:hypothetical protein